MRAKLRAGRREKESEKERGRQLEEGFRDAVIIVARRGNVCESTVYIGSVARVVFLFFFVRMKIEIALLIIHLSLA